MKKLHSLLLFASTLFLAGVGPVRAADPPPVLTVMTQNMDSGTDLGFMFQFATTNPTLGVDLTFAEVIASRTRERAALLARQIAAKQPDVVGLQEATLYSIGATPATAKLPLFDQLRFLLDALNARGARYQLVAANVLSDIALPMTLGALRYTDRDAVIVRTASGLEVSNVVTKQYAASLTFSGISVVRGFISADITKAGKTVRFVTTHLESPSDQFPEFAQVQVLQATELIATLSGSPFPVIAAGDFNSNAAVTPNDHTDTVPAFLAAGYTDAWAAANPAAAGFTNPLYFEDPLAPNPSGPFVRIDLVWEKGLDAGAIQSVELVGLQGPPFASDHTGVLARFALE